MKKYKKCKFCGQEVIAPHNHDFHISCLILANYMKNGEFDNKDICFNQELNKQENEKTKNICLKMMKYLITATINLSTPLTSK